MPNGDVLNQAEINKTIYCYCLSTKTKNKKISHTKHVISDSPLSGSMTLKEWLTTYHPGLSVEFLEKK